MKTNTETLLKFISEQNQKIKNDISKQGYKRNSPYVNNNFNIIQGTSKGTPITMQDVDFPVVGVDEFGNTQYMEPGQEYYFPGSEVTETPVAQFGGDMKFWRPVLQKGGQLPIAQKGKQVKPLYVESKNDPRYKAYNDSLQVYNHYNNLKKQIDKTKKFPDTDTNMKTTFSVTGKSESIIPKTKLQKLMSHPDSDPRKNFGKYNKGTEEIMKPVDVLKYPSDKWYSLQAGLLPIYKKPEQQVIVKNTPPSPPLPPVPPVVERPKMEAKQNNLQPENVVSNFEIEASIPITRREFIAPKYYNVEDVVNRGKSQTNYKWYPGNQDALRELSEEAGDRRTMTPVYKTGGLLSRTITCQNCGWSWKAADGSNDVSTCHKCGANNKIMQQGGYTTGNKVVYGTPEYAEAYNRGEVITDKGVRSPIALDEVVIQNNYRRPRGFWEQYRDKIVEENRDAGPLGAMLGTPVSAVFSLPQLAATKLFSGNWNNDQYRMERPSEAMDIENPYASIAVDAVTDPVGWFGASEVAALKTLTRENALAKLANIRNIKTSVAPELTEGVSQQGFTWSMNPLGKVFGKKLPEGWHRKMGSAKGIQSMMDNKAIVSPSNDHLFFAYGKKPNENYAGVFNAVIDKSKLADSEISGFSRFSGPRGKHIGVSPVTSKGKSLVNIPITDPALSVHRRIPFTNSYVPIPKEAIINGPSTLKETLLVDPTLANFQKYGEDATKIALWLSAAQQGAHSATGPADKDKYPLGVPVLQRVYEASKAYVQPQLEKTADEFQKILNSIQYTNGGLTKYQFKGEVKDEREGMIRTRDNVPTFKNDFELQMKREVVKQAQQKQQQRKAQRKFKALPKKEQERILYEQYAQQHGTITQAPEPDSKLSKFAQSMVTPFTALTDLYQKGEVRDNLLKSVINNPKTANAYDVAYLATLGRAAAPYVSSAVSAVPGVVSPYANMIGNSLRSNLFNVPGLSTGNIITAGFAGHGLANIGPDTVEMYKNPSWSNFGNLAMDTAEIFPIVGPASKTIGEGLRATGKALTTEESALAKLGTLRQTSAPVQTIVQEAAVVKPWQMEELPGLHLQSTMDNGAISRIVEPKTGLVNTEQALAIIGKESGGADKVAEIRKALGETLPKKIDYNDFRKVVQEQLVPLDVQINPNANSSYGVSSLGYDAKNRDMKLIQKELQDFISGKNTDISSLSKGTRGVITGEGNISIIDANAFSKTGVPEFLPLDTVLNKVKSNDVLLDIAYNKKYINSTPLENKTITFSNKTKFGKGSGAHNNADETLGHAHYLIDAETPDIINLTQLQSDAFQGTHRIMPKTFDPEKGKYLLGRMAEIQEKNIATLNKMKSEGAADYEIKQMQEIVDAQELRNVLEKGHVENFTQKSLLDKDHQARFLQEFVNYAAHKGNINKVRVPTSETAANVQGYGQLIQTGDNAPGFAKLQEEISIAVRQGNQEKVNELMKVHDEMLNTPYKSYNSEHQTILKKYSEQPKLIKKLFGQDAKMVTDNKGNTWYEFDIPETFKQGKGQIKAFKQGGSIVTKQKKALSWINS